MSESQPLHATAAFDRLTPRERETLRRTAAGESAKEIGRAFGISHRTVHNYQQDAARKLGVTGSVRAARLFTDHEAGRGVYVQSAPDAVAKPASDMASTASPEPIPVVPPDTMTPSGDRVPDTTEKAPAGRRIRVTPVQVLLLIVAWGLGLSITFAAVSFLYLELASRF